MGFGQALVLVGLHWTHGVPLSFLSQ
jgi:hypothetical protein